MKILKITKKGILIIRKKMISFLDYINPRLYMKHMCSLLIDMGIDMMGTPKFIHPTVWFDGVDYRKIHIAQDVVISKDVKILVHDYSIARGISALGKSDPAGAEELFLRDIYIGKNTFIGTNAIILYGSQIGDNVIIGAGSVVKGNVPDNSMVIGNPGQIVGNTVEWAKKHLELKDYLYL